MTAYNYFEAMVEDINNYINDNGISLEGYADFDEAHEDLTNELWTEDSVTGNASGSYTFSTYQAEENLCHNLDLLQEALEEFGESMGSAIEKGAEYCDVTIRCFMLSQALTQVLEDRKSQGETNW